MTEQDKLRRRYAEQLGGNGVPLDPALAAAFAAVPREAFVAEGFQRRDGGWVAPGDDDFLDTVYRDDVLVTKVAGTTPVSSSSQPSLMVAMLAALRLRPGMRVLEIGAGTGYNAALMATMGVRVTTVDVQRDVADRARAALAEAHIDGVRVVHGDGYAGVPGERFDRVIVTVGVAGVSPRWLAQLEPAQLEPAQSKLAKSEPAREGYAVVPVQHAGTHPVLAVRGAADGPVIATAVCPAGFMSAAGPLTAGHPGAHPEPASAGSLSGLVEAAGPRWRTPLGALAYRDLWYAAGVWHRRATYAALRGYDHGCLVLLDRERTGGAAILPDGSVLAGGAQAGRYAADAVDVLERWDSAGRPPLQSWRIGLDLTGQPDAPIWAPARWDPS